MSLDALNGKRNGSCPGFLYHVLLDAFGVIHFLVHPETIFCKTLTSSGFFAKGSDREQKTGCGMASHAAIQERK